MDFSKFDLNKSIVEQKLPENHFDIILATNVIHNAHNISDTLFDLKKLLRPGGLLLLNEGIAKIDYSTFIYGLSPSWWTFNDTQYRIPGTPLISLTGWQSLFANTSFHTHLSLNQKLQAPSMMNHDILIAQK